MVAGGEDKGEESAKDGSLEEEESHVVKLDKGPGEGEDL